MRALLWALLATGLVKLTGAPAIAQTPVPVELDAPFQHKHTDISVPPAADGFSRTAVMDFSGDQHNLGLQFDDPETATLATLYIYRAGEMSLPIWADRASSIILSSDRLGTIESGNLLIDTFTPPNASGMDSGFRMIAPITNSENTATALALFAHDDWLIKVRLTSETLDRDALARRMAQFIEALSFPAATRRYPTYTGVEDCQMPLRTKKDAKLLRMDMTGQIILGMAVGIAAEKADERVDDGPVWCRDAASNTGFGVYRADEDKSGYLLALNDAGYAVSVGRIDAGGLLKPSVQHAITLKDGVTLEVLPTFDRLPPPIRRAARWISFARSTPRRSSERMPATPR